MKLKIENPEVKLAKTESVMSLIRNGGSLRKICDKKGYVIGYIVRKIKNVDKEKSTAEVDLFISLNERYKISSSLCLRLEDYRAFAIEHAAKMEKQEHPWIKTIKFKDKALSPEDESTLSSWIVSASDFISLDCRPDDLDIASTIKHIRRSFNEIPLYLKDISEIIVRFDRAY